jgi:hypothetical protein
MTIDGTAVDAVEKEVNRRQEVGRLVHSLWTREGSDLSGLAPVLQDGRIDLLGKYVTFQDPGIGVRASIESHRIAPSIDRIHRKDISYDDFVSKYMHPNVPVIIQGLCDDWKAKSQWVRQMDGKGVPNLEYLRDTFGADVAPVHEQLRSGFTATRPLQKKMNVSEYADWWNSHQEQPDESSEEVLLYLKDWKFVASHPTYGAYEWPDLFQDDWLNQAVGGAYKFVYLGPKGTSTLLHADVLRSFSWSTNVCGRKRWYLIPPEYTYLLYDCFGKTLASHLHVDICNGMDAFFPGLPEAREYAIEIVQEAGETIFVPSKWYHTVENLEATLSVNHNWLNRFNIKNSWEKLKSELRSMQAEEADGQHSDAQDESKTGVNTSDSSQVGDDLLLLWHVLSKKARYHLKDFQEGRNNSQRLFDVQAIFFVLTEMKDVISDDCALDLAKRTDCDVMDLLESLQSILDEKL